MLCPLSYVPKDGGTRTRDRWIQEGTPVYATGGSLYRGIDVVEALDLVPLSVGLRERAVLTARFELALIAVWARRLFQLGYVSVDQVGLEPTTFSLQGSCASKLRHRPVGRGSGNRTRVQGV